MKFCRAEESDLPRVLALFAGAVERMLNNGIHQWDELYPDEATLSADIENRQMYLLCEGEALLAAVVLNEEQAPEYQNVNWSLREEPVAVIHRLCVDARTQGKGIGGETLRLAEQALLRQGYRCIRLDAFPQNPSACRMYEKNGYRLAGEIPFPRGFLSCYEKRLFPEEIAE